MWCWGLPWRFWSHTKRGTSGKRQGAVVTGVRSGMHCMSWLCRLAGWLSAVNQFASKAMGFAYDAFLLPNLPLINSLLMGSVGGGGGQGATTASPADDHSRNIPTEASNKKTE